MKINRFSRIIWGIPLGFFLALSFCGTGMCGLGQSKKKILFVNSYDIDNRWFQRIFQGAVEVLDLKIDNMFHPDDSESPVQFALYNMKTKKNRSEAYKQKPKNHSPP